MQLFYLRKLVDNYIAKYYFNVFVSVFFMVVVATTTALITYLMEPAINQVFINKDRSSMYYVCVAILAVSLVRGFAAYMQKVILSRVEFCVIRDMEKDLFSSMISMSMSEFNNLSSGKVMTSFINDIINIKQALSLFLVNIFREVMTIIGLVGVMFYRDWKMSIFALLIFPFALLPVARIAKRLKKLSREIQSNQENITTKLQSIVDNIRLIKFSCTEQYEIKEFSRYIDLKNLLDNKIVKKSSISSPLMEFFSSVAIVVAIIYGGSSVINGEATPGDFFSFLTSMLLMYKPAKGLTGMMSVLQLSFVSMERLFDFIKPDFCKIDNLTGEIKSNNHKNDTLISFDKISYVAGGEDIIKQVSFDVKVKEKIAVVGTSGSGKSSIINLLLRFYRYNSGNIFYKGNSIDDFSLVNYYKNFGYVMQDSYLFNGSVLYNIFYGLDARFRDIDMVYRLCNELGFDNFISSLPNGLDTIIGTDGAILSGGERQRIAIVRALLRHPEVLLLDEATSALDNESEKTILDYIFAQQNLSTIIITHRLNNVLNCDKIFVVDDGSIVESGTSYDLLNDRSSKFYNLWSSKY